MDTCLRTCLLRDTSCLGCLSRQGSRVIFDEGREDMSWCSKQDVQSHTHRAYPHAHSLEEKTLTALIQWCATARVRPPFRWHGCCERSEGEHHSHRTVPQEEQSGRCWRHCTRRSFEGNGFEFTMSVQGTCLSSPNMSLHIEV